MTFDPRDVATWPITLTVDELSAIYRRSVGGIRKAVQQRRFYPLPFQRKPYLWRRDDVRQHVERQSPSSHLRRVG